MRARRTTLLLVAALLAPVAPQPASAHGLVTVLLVVERTSNGSTTFDLELVAEPGHERSFVGAIGTRLRNGRAETVFPAGMKTQGTADGVSVDVPLACGRGCAARVAHTEHGMGIHYRDDLAAEKLNRFFVVLRAEKPHYTFVGDGWVLRRRAFGYRVVNGDESDADYAGAGGHRVEVFTSTPKVPGGRYGSLAQADPPCSNPVTTSVSAGAGQVTLDGGTQPVQVTCPTSRPRTIGALATKATSWRLHGTVAGETKDAVARLMVVDLPR